jgi:8-oxo-dGTP diphosphatase
MFCAYCGERLPALPPTVCTACGEPQWLNPKPCAGIVLVDETGERVLLVERAQDPWRGRWDLPGGFCDAGEHPEATAVREAKEELGIDVELIGYLGAWTDVYVDERADRGERPVETILCLYYTARGLGSTTDLRVDPAEIGAVRWFDRHDLPLHAMAFPDHMPLVLTTWQDRTGGA